MWGLRTWSGQPVESVCLEMEPHSKGTEQPENYPLIQDRKGQQKMLCSSMVHTQSASLVKFCFLFLRTPVLWLLLPKKLFECMEGQRCFEPLVWISSVRICIRRMTPLANVINIDGAQCFQKTKIKQLSRTNTFWEKAHRDRNQHNKTEERFCRKPSGLSPGRKWGWACVSSTLYLTSCSWLPLCL